MTPYHPLFALVVFLIAFLTAYLINLKYQLKPAPNRYETLDGLRGLLAISVFIHHTSVWYGYLQTDNWAEPNSYLFNQLGQSSVALFFMISSFLFISKLLNFKGAEYPWKSFFIGRFFRIVPLYILSFVSVVLIVGVLSEWSLRVAVFDFLKNIIRWSGLGILGQPNLNGIENTATINSFVNWSLLYEWLLYFSLPLISIFILKAKPKIYYLIWSILFFVFAWQYRNLELQHLFSLIGGAIAAIIFKYNASKINFNQSFISFSIIGALIMVIQFPNSGNLVSKLFLIFAFILISLGNDLFGFLKNNTLKLMGEISYSTYLLHGILIFLAIHFGYGVAATQSLSTTAYCGMMMALTPVLMVVSFLTYLFIEKPFIERSKKFRGKLVETTSQKMEERNE